MRRAFINRIRRIQASADERSLLDRLLLSAYARYRKLKERVRKSDNEQVNKLFLQAKNLKRNFRGKRLTFVNIDQATIWTQEWIKTFPHRYDLVVGVPRSGLFIASIIAVKLGRPLTTPDLLQKGEFWHSKKVKDRPDLGKVNRILLVDDSIDSGRSLARAYDIVRSATRDCEITRACLIVREEARESVELYHQVLAPPRTFEWNILHRKIGSQFEHGLLGVDLDGVLCVDPPPGADEDEKAYLEWLPVARPYLVPEFEIDVIVTCRLEKYRPQTEAWLEQNNVRYRDLVMWDLPAKSDRRGRFARHKIDSLLGIKPDMFWESNWDQAQAIWNETRIPTLCIDRMTMLS